jgi:hypothetical protein
MTGAADPYERSTFRDRVGYRHQAPALETADL